MAWGGSDAPGRGEATGPFPSLRGWREKTQEQEEFQSELGLQTATPATVVQFYTSKQWKIMFAVASSRGRMCVKMKKKKEDSMK